LGAPAAALGEFNRCRLNAPTATASWPLPQTASHAPRPRLRYHINLLDGHWTLLGGHWSIQAASRLSDE
jgi:hypothetical protein